MKIEKFVKHRPTDRSDPGFTIPGGKLRWIAGPVAENSPGRPWQVLKRSDLPKELVEHLVSHNPSAFSQGDVVRRAELSLAFCPNEIHQDYAKQIRQAAIEQESRVKRPPSSRATVEINEDRDVTNEMIERFKKKDQSQED